MTLRLIEGGLAPLRLAGVTLHVARDDEILPFLIDAAVSEQDTWLTLGPAPEQLPGDGNPLRTLTRALDVAPRALGTVDVRAGEPLLVRAVVIDVDGDTLCAPTDVEAAARAALHACRAHGARAIRFPLLGCERGRLPTHDSAVAIARAVAAFAAAFADGADGADGAAAGDASDAHIEVALVVPAAAHALLHEVVRDALG